MAERSYAEVRAQLAARDAQEQALVTVRRNMSRARDHLNAGKPRAARGALSRAKKAMSQTHPRHSSDFAAQHIPDMERAISIREEQAGKKKKAKKKGKKKAPGTVMTGKKGGKYMVSKSGKKIYVGRKGGR